MAIRLNNAGIVEAIKAKSGSTKFYRPSFEGIIQAIQDWTGGGGEGTVNILPPGSQLPNTGDEGNGDMVGIPNGDGDYFIYIYANGAWQAINVTTAQVLEADKKPVGATMPKFITPDGTALETQQDYNKYIAEVIVVDQIRQDEDIEELKEDQDRQDKDLEDYKKEVAADQERQDDAWAEDQERQDALIEEIIADINKSKDPDDGSTSYRFVTHDEFSADQDRQDEDNENKFVKVSGGDTMEGQLIINGPRKAGDNVDNPDLVSSLKVLSIDNAQNSSIQLRHSGNAKVYVGDTDISIASDIKINRATGSVVRTNVQELLNISEQEIAYLGRSIEDEDLITKKYVDDAKDYLQNEIIELEEELEALAPSLERGTWLFNPTGAAGVSQFGLFAIGTSTSEFPQADSLFINNVDTSGTVHSFTDVKVGSYVEIFSSDDADFGLYQIKAVYDETAGANSFWQFDVEHIRSNRLIAQAAAVCRFKFFELSEGADPTSYVVNVGGDSMEGPLQVTGSRNADLTNGSRVESTIKVLNVDSGQNSSLNLKHNGTTRIYVSSTQTSFQGDIKFNNAGSALYAGDDKKGFVINENGVFYDGAYTVDKHVATKKNVDDALDFSKYPELS